MIITTPDVKCPKCGHVFDYTQGRLGDLEDE